jgi:hypothetical protein
LSIIYFLPFRSLLWKPFRRVLQFANGVLFRLSLNRCATAFAEMFEFSFGLFVRLFARHRTGIRQNSTFVEPQEVVELLLPIIQEHLLAAFGLVKNRGQAVLLNVSGDFPLAFDSNYSEFPNSCVTSEFTIG